MSRRFSEPAFRRSITAAIDRWWYCQYLQGCQEKLAGLNEKARFAGTGTQLFGIPQSAVNSPAGFPHYLLSC